MPKALNDKLKIKMIKHMKRTDIIHKVQTFIALKMINIFLSKSIEKFRNSQQNS